MASWVRVQHQGAMHGFTARPTSSLGTTGMRSTSTEPKNVIDIIIATAQCHLTNRCPTCRPRSGYLWCARLHKMSTIGWRHRRDSIFLHKARRLVRMFANRARAARPSENASNLVPTCFGTMSMPLTRPMAARIVRLCKVKRRTPLVSVYAHCHVARLMSNRGPLHLSRFEVNGPSRGHGAKPKPIPST